MKQILTAVIASFVLLTACSESVVATKYVDPIAVSYPITTQNGQRYCSATKIAENRFLTAAHCTTSLELFIEDKYGEIHPANLVKSYPLHDLAILSANIPGPWAVLLPVKPKLGEPVVVVGFPLGIGPFVVEGLWNGEVLWPSDDPNPRNVVSAPIAPGNSGGGVFVYHQGRWKLCAVAQAIPNIGGFAPLPVFHIGLVSDYSVLKEIMDEAN